MNIRKIIRNNKIKYKKININLLIHRILIMILIKKKKQII